MLRATVYFATTFILLSNSIPVWGQSKKPINLPELAAYSGADREQMLRAGAKAEGKVVWYTSFTGNSYKQLARAFENQYRK